jgi:peptide deformylase
LRIDDPDDYKTLKARSRAVRLPNPALRQLVADMFETMHAADGVGIAAPQVGIPQRLAVIAIVPRSEEGGPERNGDELPVQRYVLANPMIVKASREHVTILDGCLSLPGWYGEVPRAAWVTVDYQDLDGRPQRLRKATGLLACALQHEIDHLDGILFTERIRDLATLKRYY